MLPLSDPSKAGLRRLTRSRCFGFKEDIVLRVHPTEDGTGSVVDMRSVSRVGDGDRGGNAKRIRAYLADLSGTVTGG